MNRSGKHPGLECKPAARKAIADLANLESPVPAIKKAAEIKQAEDLKPQKIKAVRYLTKLGCGCYDIDGSITEALIAATSDCTEDVRLATVEAISEAASNKCCSNCGMTCCCKEDMVKRLAQMAYERDETGCYLEPSQRVRQAAALALRTCCPNTEPVLIETPEEEADETPRPPKREGAVSDDTEDREGADDEAAGDADAEQPEPPAEDDTASIQSRISAATGMLLAETRQLARDCGLERSHIRRNDSRGRKSRCGSCAHRAQGNDSSRWYDALCYHDIDGQYVFAGRVRVYQTFAGSVNVQAVDEADLGAIVFGASCFVRELSSNTDRVARVASLAPLEDVAISDSRKISAGSDSRFGLPVPALQFVEPQTEIVTQELSEPPHETTVAATAQDSTSKTPAQADPSLSSIAIDASQVEIGRT